MKPDKFDETIRQKLEGVQPNFQERDWAKFKTYQANHIPQSFLQRYGTKMLYTAASMAAAMMVFANVYQYRKNQQLELQVSGLKTKLALKDQTPIRALSRIDTVFVTKYVRVKSAQTRKNDIAISTNDDNQQLPSFAKEKQPALDEIQAAKTTQQNTSLENVIQQAVVPSKGEISKSKKLLARKEPSSTKKGTQNNLEKSPSLSELRSSSNKETKNQLFENKNATGNVPQVSETISSSDRINVELHLLESNYNIEKLESISPADPMVQRYAYAQMTPTIKTSEVTSTEAKTIPPPPSISFKDIKLRVGAGFNIGDKYTATSLNTSVLMGKYWSLDVGLSKAEINGPQFYTEDVFKVKTKKDFDVWQKSFNPPPLALPQALDIKTSVTLWRLPIHLTYRWPVKDGFTFLVSGGTNLNLSAKQRYSFVTKERNGNWIEKTGEFDAKTELSNDIVLAGGLEKQWRHLIIQAEAYTAPYLKKPTYLTENRNLGIRFKVMYQFGKK